LFPFHGNAWRISGIKRQVKLNLDPSDLASGATGRFDFFEQLVFYNRGTTAKDKSRLAFCQHENMSVTVKLDLPESVAAEARARGLLDPKRVASLIARELSSEQDLRNFFEIVREIRAQPGEPNTMEEIQAEVDAVRVEKHASEGRC
jgi:hypothetical protein